MTSRAERRRAQREARGITEIRPEDMPRDAMLQSVCAWGNCENTCFATEPLPAEWKHLVVASGSLFDHRSLLTADRDGILCPVHFEDLEDLLK